MRRTLKLRTGEGKDFRIILDNWGSGVDQSMRRWILQDGLWQCTDSGALAEESVVDFKRSVRQLLHAPTPLTPRKRHVTSTKRRWRRCVARPWRSMPVECLQLNGARHRFDGEWH